MIREIKEVRNEKISMKLIKLKYFYFLK
jgi:hypothetical protein